MARPGRKRKSGDREPNGRPQRAGPDRGTDQLQARRLWLAQGGDVTKTSYPLGIMLVNGIIDEPQHSAGVRYGWLHLVLFGKGTPVAASYGGAVTGACGHPWMDEIEQEFLQECESALQTADRVLRRANADTALYDLIVLQRTPNWLRPALPNRSDFAHSRRVIDGLWSLARHMGYVCAPAKIA